MKGYYRPKNPQKYKGDPTNIIYRSSWEKRCMIYFDQNSNVIQWHSEELFVPYRSPIDGRLHRYFPDFWVKKKDESICIEVKPSTQCKPPKVEKRLTPKGRISKTYLTEVKNWGINSAKWEAAERYCKQKGWRFVIMTEKDLTPNG